MASETIALAKVTEAIADKGEIVAAISKGHDGL
jgi:hypothetical protein